MDKPQRASVGGAGRSGLLQDRQVVYVARGETYRGASGGALRVEKDGEDVLAAHVAYGNV